MYTSSSGCDAPELLTTSATRSSNAPLVEAVSDLLRGVEARGAKVLDIRKEILVALALASPYLPCPGATFEAIYSWLEEDPKARLPVAEVARAVARFNAQAVRKKPAKRESNSPMRFWITKKPDEHLF